jgi:hypothetical protein
MSLDINTPRGQVAAADQIRAAEIVFGGESQRAAGFSFIHTQTDEASAVDGFIVKDGMIAGLAEIKSRDMTYEQLMGPFKGEWLLTMQKLSDIAHLSKLLRVAGYGLVYCVPSNLVLGVLLTSKQGLIECTYRTENTTTKESCNGGSAQRLNAFIQMKNARIYHK